MLNAATQLAETFQSYFTVSLATTPELRRKVFEIRYRVYCEEFGYFPTSAFPDGQEHDSFDDDATHCLISHVPTGEPAACVRIVPAMSNGRDLLPLEHASADALDEEFIKSLNLDRSTVCEISRLAVDPAFRRRRDETATRMGVIEAMDASMLQHRAFPMLSLAGFLTAIAITDLSRHTSVFAMLEPLVAQQLEKAGIRFVTAGREDHQIGTRRPYYVSTQSALDNMQPELGKLFGYIYQRVADGFTEDN